MMSVIHSQYCKNLSPITDFNTGEIACGTCGSVILEKAIDIGPEQTGFTKEEYESNTRVGTKLTLKMSDMGLSTVIQQSNKDSTGKSLSTENSKIFYRLRLWDRNSKSKQEYKSFNKAFSLLDGIRAKLGLPESVVEKSAHIFRKAAGKKILSGRSTAGILCATVYLACRITGTPRTLQDIADAGNIKRKNLQKNYRFLVNELDITPETYSPADFVERVLNDVGVGKKTRMDAIRLMSRVLDAGISTSKNPMSMAAAVVNLASVRNNEKISQLKISEISGISSVTIRDRSKEIRKKIGGEW
ncbi:MAG: transcription factor TFIIB [Nitrosopumilaceae archaeon]|nr:transcription factor TFIIB [Nitrosopumilaceae archaeon]NIP09943.1 transcription factor TFIIB [Nitrosopumilaceae archaeon]NIS94714.1 transcription factor TFIIB [Nitrosopumilaceae archaeon]